MKTERAVSLLEADRSFCIEAKPCRNTEILRRYGRKMKKF